MPKTFFCLDQSHQRPKEAACSPINLIDTTRTEQKDIKPVVTTPLSTSHSFLATKICYWNAYVSLTLTKQLTMAFAIHAAIYSLS